MYTVEITKMVERMHLTNLTPEIDLTGRVISTPEINRPALQLAGFFSDFDPNRVQLIGNVEYAYMYHNEMNSEQRHICFSRLMGYGVPCIIFCRNLPVSDGMKKLALEKCGEPALPAASARAPQPVRSSPWRSRTAERPSQVPASSCRRLPAGFGRI